MIENSTHQPTASSALSPTDVPSSRPRTVLITGVNGWYSANQRSQPGSESFGTKPLARNGSSVNISGVLLAVSTDFAFNPSATASHVSATVVNNNSPVRASHSTGPADGRNPTRNATPSTTANPIAVWISVPITCPVSTDALLIDMVRKRAMIPCVMSMATDIAVPRIAPVIVMIRMVGVTKPM